ncbi:aryl-sulfate sulfotransferase [Ferrimonas lipolytica]|uniref:Aryl-sulfate sulfotransferase n=1 Tax=Ferrimonas lipolytica TaxID=2724191 RepID=A0A6H1UI48_9GAMM|nr:aryl-sulfate sulfotransferase [Ferrimonas lipolytica]
MKKTFVAAALLAAISPSIFAAGFAPAPAAGQLGAVIVNPYSNSPLTALIDLGGKKIDSAKVIVHGKGKNGVDIKYDVSRKIILRHDGIPVFGLYADHKNKVTISYELDGEKTSENYDVITSAITNNYIDNRNVTALQETQVKTVAKGFEDRLYFINSNDTPQMGSDLHWAGPKSASAHILDPSPSAGSMTFDQPPMNFIIDTQGEYRWWMNQDAVYDGFDIDVNNRGIMMGFEPDNKGNFTFLLGQKWGYMDLMGKFTTFRLPRGYIDASHETTTMPNGNVLIRAAKSHYLNKAGEKVHTVRDHIIEVDQQGNLVDVWALPEILNPFRDNLLVGLDMGAVCLNVDADHQGQSTEEFKVDAPYGDVVGVGAGRNWAHVNSIDYNAEDDSIVLSLRHQGIVKIGRDKKVDWILAPDLGWGDLSDKVLTPVDSKGRKLNCDGAACDGTDFDWTYTQHTAWWSDKGTLTVFDNGDGRGYTQPAMPTMKYSRFVEYKIDEDKGTVEQTWEYGKERGYDWYSPITSNVEYMSDRNTMFGFGGSIHLFEPGARSIGKINEIDYDTKEVKVEIDVLSAKKNAPHYRALLVKPNKMFNVK